MIKYARWKVVLLGAAALGVAATAAGCVTPTASGTVVVPSGQPQRAASTADASAGLVAAINSFGLELVSTASTDNTENTIVSPLSVHAALSMTANGATGETGEQMHEVLRTDAMTVEDVNEQWASLLRGLDARGTSRKLEIANSLWAREGVAFKKPFIDSVSDYFGAQVSTLDFEKDDVAAAINRWVSKHTGKKITRIVQEVPDNAILYLANAVYFEGDWVTPFDRESTFERPFTRPDGSKLDVNMMHMTEEMPYYENASLKVTRLMYKGDDSAYYVMLPQPGVSLDTALASMQGTGFAEMRAAMTSEGTTEVILGLPKLDAEFSAMLKEPLAAMGMPRAFDDLEAQFSDMADLSVPIYIGEVLHKAKVKVDEKGTIAAAATAADLAPGSAAPVGDPPTIICDRPYAFAIVDERSGTMLFLGAVNDPNR